MQPYSSPSNIKLVSTLVAIIIIAGVVVFADHARSEQHASAQATHTVAVAVPSSNSQPSSAGASPTPTTSPSSSSAYTDGTFAASSDYAVPSGSENVKVTLTIANGIVTDSSIANSEYDRVSQLYQQDFASQYKQYVVGKSIKALRIGVVAGASDTSIGFNSAVASIASQAKA